MPKQTLQPKQGLNIAHHISYSVVVYCGIRAKSPLYRIKSSHKRVFEIGTLFNQCCRQRDGEKWNFQGFSPSNELRASVPILMHVVVSSKGWKRGEKISILWLSHGMAHVPCSCTCSMKRTTTFKDSNFSINFHNSRDFLVHNLALDRLCVCLKCTFLTLYCLMRNLCWNLVNFLSIAALLYTYLTWARFL